MIIIGTNVWVIQKGEKLVPMADQTLPDALDIWVNDLLLLLGQGKKGLDHLVSALVEDDSSLVFDHTHCFTYL